MATQREVAEKLGISQQAVQKSFQKMGIKDWKTRSVDDVVRLYVAKLIAQASAHEGHATKMNLVDVRVQRELKETELLDLKIAKEREEVVDMKQLLPVMEAIWQGCKTKILGRASKLKTKLDALYGVDIDIELLEEEDEGLLDDLSGYVSSYRQNHSGLDGSVETAKEDNND